MRSKEAQPPAGPVPRPRPIPFRIRVPWGPAPGGDSKTGAPADLDDLNGPTPPDAPLSLLWLWRVRRRR